uniref:TlpA family protein disulfide reductase n=1 Tax=Candidatus Caldatribacterium saccharofermentans TaxID=1454753 RepID=A0A7V4WM68_9BACT
MVGNGVRRVGRRVFWVLAGIAIFAGVYAFFSLSRPHLEKDFSLYDLNNRRIRLSRFSGRPLIVYFFSPRCKDCKEEAPLLNELYEAYREEGLVIVGVGVKYPEEVREFAERQGIRYPVVVDQDLSVSRDFGVFFLPHLVFFNRQGKIVSAATGKVSPEKLREYLESIL